MPGVINQIEERVKDLVWVLGFLCRAVAFGFTGKMMNTRLLVASCAYSLELLCGLQSHACGRNPATASKKAAMT